MPGAGIEKPTRTRRSLRVWGMSGSRRGSALLRELSRAEAKIETLEEFISERERQLHVAVSRLRSRGGDSRRTSRTNISTARRRRLGITSDAALFRTSRDSLEYFDDGELPYKLLCSLGARPSQKTGTETKLLW